MGLFFQQEVLREAAAPDTSSTGSGGGGSASPGGSPLTAASFPVLLLSGDNAQVQTARSHGLPAARMADLAAAQRQLEAALAEGQPLAASLLRSCLGPAAVTGEPLLGGAGQLLCLPWQLAGQYLLCRRSTSPASPLAATDARLACAHIAGLGAVAARSLQAEFDDAVAALHMATEALTAVAAAAASEGPAEEALVAVRRALGGGGGLLPALQGRLAELQGRVATHQDPSRLLRWASSGRSSLSERSERGAGAGAAPSGATS